ncbi:hypothetical protein HQQ81_08135 [Microbacteriaceae bacterium VKM Ac-2854]|nr:hypothetical protein [Microbacteriaceae bacterium VKM Ac-2854]
MTHPIWASGMLRTAGILAGQNAGQGRPALSDLRRATSTAYYALFHQIIRHGAFHAVRGASEDDVSNITRWFTHTGIKEACGWVQTAADLTRQPNKSNRSALVLLRGIPAKPVPPKLLTLAESFIELQDARHEADYSNDYDPVRYRTLDHVATAEAAVKVSWSMWGASESSNPARVELWEAYSRFLTLCLVASGGPKSRG